MPTLTLTRGEVAKKIGTAASCLIYWEQKGELKPKKITVGSKTLFAYSPALIRKAKRIFSRDNREKQEKKQEKNRDRKK